MIRQLYLVFVVAVFIGLGFTCMADDEPMIAIRYEQYPVKNIFKGKPVAPRLEDHDARNFRTVIRDGATNGPNFAGEYTIIEHGCGTCCIGFFIVNARTGKVYKRPFYIECHYKEGVPANGLVALDYRLDSKLLIISGVPGKRSGGVYYYLWENDHLRLLKSFEEIAE